MRSARSDDRIGGVLGRFAGRFADGRSVDDGVVGRFADGWSGDDGFEGSGGLEARIWQ